MKELIKSCWSFFRDYTKRTEQVTHPVDELRALLVDEKEIQLEEELLYRRKRNNAMKQKDIVLRGLKAVRDNPKTAASHRRKCVKLIESTGT